MRSDPNPQLRDAAKAWLCLLLSMMWIGLGIAGFMFVFQSQYFGSVALASLGVILLSGVLVLKGGYMFIISLISLFRR